MFFVFKNNKWLNNETRKPTWSTPTWLFIFRHCRCSTFQSDLDDGNDDDGDDDGSDGHDFNDDGSDDDGDDDGSDGHDLSLTSLTCVTFLVAHFCSKRKVSFSLQTWSTTCNKASCFGIKIFLKVISTSRQKGFVTSTHSSTLSLHSWVSSGTHLKHVII